MNEKEAVDLLRKYARTVKDFESVLKHVKLVQKEALRIAREIINNGHTVDLEYIRVASLLHDIGSFDYPPGKDRIKHGVRGGEILRLEGHPEYASICENHIGVGITKKDIITQNLPLPKKNFVPKTLEENIIAYADNLEDKGEIKTIEWVIERFRRELGDEYVERVIKQHKKIEKLRKK